jgi:hypothetical protein
MALFLNLFSHFLEQMQSEFRLLENTYFCQSVSPTELLSPPSEFPSSMIAAATRSALLFRLVGIFVVGVVLVGVTTV